MTTWKYTISPKDDGQLYGVAHHPDGANVSCHGKDKATVKSQLQALAATKQTELANMNESGTFDVDAP